MEREANSLERMDSEYVDALNGAFPDPPQQFQNPIKKINMDVNLGVNLSIAIILLIFSGLLFLPSKMLFDTSYEVQNASTNQSSIFPNPLELKNLRKKKLCPGPNYRYLMASTFLSNYDKNCSVKIVRKKIEKKIEKKGKIVSTKDKKECKSDKKEAIISWNYNRTIDEVRPTRPKSIPVTGHILAMMLIVSAVAAFVEVLRIRFINPKDSSAVESAGSRKGSTVELMTQRRFLTRAPMRSQRSFELQGTHRSPLRIIGARPSTVIRRCSFPYLAETLDVDPTTDESTSSRRPSVSAEVIEPVPFIFALHRRARLIRRH